MEASHSQAHQDLHPIPALRASVLVLPAEHTVQESLRLRLGSPVFTPEAQLTLKSLVHQLLSPVPRHSYTSLSLPDWHTYAPPSFPKTPDY